MSWLETAILDVRAYTNEPPAKWSDARVIHILEQAGAVELGDIMAQSCGPNTVLWELQLVPGTRHYQRPPHVGTILAIFKANDNYEREWFVAPRSRDSVFGPGIHFDNDMINVDPTVQDDDLLHVWYRHSGEIRLAAGPLHASSSAGSLVLSAPTLGTLDTRDMGYAGATCRVTATDGRIEDRHAATSSFDGTTHTLTTVIDYTVPLAGATYELVPAFGSLFLAAICYQASLMILAPDAPAARIARINDRLQAVRRQLRQNTARLNGITGKRFCGDTWLARTAPADGWRGRRTAR